jgi:uncharacterized flavoprotein (TIGR03862 family)
MKGLVIGAGPAGLMAAGEMARAGLDVTIADAMPSAGRKFLMAGKSGLNLTKDEPLEQFLSRFQGSVDVTPALRVFGPAEVRDWAIGLGQELFTGSSARVFPRAMKASPLLRAWLARLDGQGVRLEPRWRWVGLDGRVMQFDTPNGAVRLEPDATVLALGGASWSRLGSDGVWADFLKPLGVDIAPFKPANAGLSVAWSGHMEKHFGTPVKAAALHIGTTRIRGEFVISKRGLEGSAIYAAFRDIREGAALTLDLAPDLALDQIRARLAKPRGKASLSNHLRKALRLDPARIALIQEFARPLPADIAPLIKALPVHHQGPRPMDEAISTAGGIAGTALGENLMLRALPGVFAAGEMLDWEAPTGGYLMTACLATGQQAGQAAAQFASI